MTRSYDSFVWYTSGYKFKTEAEFVIATGIVPNVVGGNQFVSIDGSGILTIAPNYAWDGASGPALDTHSFIRGSLVHDALYQLIREGYLTMADREAADKLLVELTAEDGMWAIRRAWVYFGVRTFGGLYMKMRKTEWKVAPYHPGEIS